VRVRVCVCVRVCLHVCECVTVIWVCVVHVCIYPFTADCCRQFRKMKYCVWSMMFSLTVVTWASCWEKKSKVSKARARMPGEEGGGRERRRERRVCVRLVWNHTRESLRTHTTQTRTRTCAQTNTDTDTNKGTQTHRRTDTQTRRHADTQTRRHADTQTQRGMDAKRHRRIDAHTTHANTHTFMHIKKCPSAYTHKCSKSRRKKKREGEKGPC